MPMEFVTPTSAPIPARRSPVDRPLPVSQTYAGLAYRENPREPIARLQPTESPTGIRVAGVTVVSVRVVSADRLTALAPPMPAKAAKPKSAWGFPSGIAARAP